MAFPRITAAVIVFLIIGSFISMGVGGVAFLGPSLTHSMQTEHNAGKILRINPDMSFQLKTTDGRVVRFQCTDRCRASLDHMQRHEREQANTDVYYVAEANNVLLALDVD